MTRQGKVLLQDFHLNLASRDQKDHGLLRSWSFTGVPTKPHSAPTTPLSAPILGEFFKSPKARFKDGTKLKIPRVPSPARAKLMFDSIKRGLRECVEATEEDIQKLQSADDTSPTSSSAQQVKAAEMYKKRLEFHLSRVQALEENYILNEQLREGVKNMAKAYVSMNTSHKSHLHNVKCGYKECTQLMCTIEAQLENMLGTLHCRMKGMVGFARLVPGDVFEITIRHGTQKWKSKGRIGTNGQTWDHENMVFKALVGDILTIKAVELKGLGKSVVLGEKRCETKDLLSSHPQMMTVNINANGSLKLSVIITWNPLEGVIESGFSDALSRDNSRKRIGTNSVSEQNLASTSAGLSSPSTSSPTPHRDELQSRLNPPSSADPRRPRSESTSAATRPHSLTGVSGLYSDPKHDLKFTFDSPKEKSFDMNRLSQSLNGRYSRQDSRCLDEALHSIQAVLEDYQGHYVELQKLEEQIRKLDKLIKKRLGAQSTRSSNVSISIESALGAFDFLESEYHFMDARSMGHSRSNHASLEALEMSCSLSPESTARTTDSGIESIVRHLSEDRLSSIASSPEPVSTGNEQVDQALLWHLTYCEKLLENLGQFGPLKCKEIYSLDKLQKQANILEHLLHAAPHIRDLHEILSQLTDSKTLKQLWTQSVDHTVLYTNAECFLAHLEHRYGSVVRNKYEVPASKVFKGLVAQILDLPEFDPETLRPCPIITLYQLMMFFSEPGRPNIEEYLQELAAEVWVDSRLKSGDVDTVIKTVLTLQTDTPPIHCLRLLSLMLLVDDVQVRTCVANYFKGLVTNTEARKKAVVVFVEALEDGSHELRCAACVSLSLLQASESMDQLAYICHTDPSSMVMASAKETLYSFGVEGRKAYEDCQLSCHGFQGIQVQL